MPSGAVASSAKSSVQLHPASALLDVGNLEHFALLSAVGRTTVQQRRPFEIMREVVLTKVRPDNRIPKRHRVGFANETQREDCDQRRQTTIDRVFIGATTSQEHDPSCRKSSSVSCHSMLEAHSVLAKVAIVVPELAVNLMDRVITIAQQIFAQIFVLMVSHTSCEEVSNQFCISESCVHGVMS